MFSANSIFYKQLLSKDWQV